MPWLCFTLLLLPVIQGESGNMAGNIKFILCLFIYWQYFPATICFYISIWIRIKLFYGFCYEDKSKEGSIFFLRESYLILSSKRKPVSIAFKSKNLCSGDKLECIISIARYIFVYLYWPYFSWQNCLEVVIYTPIGNRLLYSMLSGHLWDQLLLSLQLSERRCLFFRGWVLCLQGR